MRAGAIGLTLAMASVGRSHHPALRQYLHLPAAVGQAIVAVPLGKTEPDTAPHQTAEEANAMLAVLA